jgi:integrase
MVLVAGCLGLRISEILGLRWGDIDWENLIVLVQRSVVDGKVYDTKTEASQTLLPIDPDLAEALLMFRRQMNLYTQAVAPAKREAVHQVAMALLKR